MLLLVPLRVAQYHNEEYDKGYDWNDVCHRDGSSSSVRIVFRTARTGVDDFLPRDRVYYVITTRNFVGLRRLNLRFRSLEAREKNRMIDAGADQFCLPDNFRFDIPRFARSRPPRRREIDRSIRLDA